jgi:signal transduction histidine kinase
MDRECQIVIGPDGTVLAATGELAAGLLDVRLEDCQGLSREVREAGKALLQQLHRSRNRVLVQSVLLDGGARSVQLVAIEAVAIRRTNTDLRTLLSSKLAVLSSQALGAGVTLRIVVADHVPAVVHIDAEKVAWAVTTLVGNALRYVQSAPRRPPAGAITVRAAFDPRGAQVTIEVHDNGPGIPAESVARLFKRDRLNVLGSGLSLLMISDVCVAHGGRLDVTSSTQPADHGTTGRMTLSAA